jgi:hypothetical protein
VTYSAISSPKANQCSNWSFGSRSISMSARAAWASPLIRCTGKSPSISQLARTLRNRATLVACGAESPAVRARSHLSAVCRDTATPAASSADVYTPFAAMAARKRPPKPALFLCLFFVRTTGNCNGWEAVIPELNLVTNVNFPQSEAR